MADKRHLNRIDIVQELFSFTFNPGTSLSEKSQEISKHYTYLDSLIQTGAPKYTINQIAKVDLSILHLALFELLIEKKEPPKVIINEAIELAKELGGEKSPGFINAVLGKIYRESLEDNKSTS
ncbi:MAG TPA: transcription antitermination protein NusB [Candidatus Nitrosocosmicus sp.]|nr:transcription antitermination protein NusB [Candidatus Nitrosocosmicus sp.]